MKRVSTVSLALALGLAGLVVSPAMAAKKEKAVKAVPAEISKEFRAAIAQAKSYADASAKLALAVPLANLPDEKFYVGSVRYDIAVGTNDAAGTRKAINDMIASGSKLTSNLPKLYFASGSAAYNVGDNADAVLKLTEAERLGIKSADLYITLADSLFRLKRMPEGLVAAEKAIGIKTAAGEVASDSWYKRARAAAYQGKMSKEVTKWSMMLIRAHPNDGNWRDALVTYRDTNALDPLVQIDLYRLMRVTKGLQGERDFAEYADLANARALPGEAKSVIEEGLASGAANKTSTQIRERLADANGKLAADQASVANDDRLSRTAADGKRAANTGNAHLAYGQYAKAIELLKISLAKGGADADAVNTRLGIANARLGQKAEARQAFSAVGAGTRSDIAKFWLLWLDLNP
jgi:tetratricopeptide (TPR) repeat protein